MNSKILFNIFFLTFLFAFTSFANPISYSKLLKNKPFPLSLGENDFFIKISNEPKLRSINMPILSVESCRKHIKDIICLVNPTEEGQEPENRKCLEGSNNYTAVFEEIFNYYSEPLQKMFCSLKHIFIEKEIEGTGYAGMLHDDNGTITGIYMGYGKSFIDQNLSLHSWASWKDQLSFGGNSNSFILKEDLPLINTNSPENFNDFLFFVVAHEFGHFFDFLNNVNQFKQPSVETIDEEDTYPELEVIEGTWSSISWKTNKKPKVEHDFINRDKLCFYWCEDSFIERDSINQLYFDLFNSSFISLYASTYPSEDFAESVAYYVMYKYVNASYFIETNQGIKFNMMYKITSPQFFEKFMYLEEFFKRNDLIYP